MPKKYAVVRKRINEQTTAGVHDTIEAAQRQLEEHTEAAECKDGVEVVRNDAYMSSVFLNGVFVFSIVIEERGSV